MGIVHTHRGRLAPALILAVLMALAIIVTHGLAASPASAQQTFTQCGSCHGRSATHGIPNHASVGCATCHNNGGTSNPPLPSACAACHGGTTAILSANATHTSLKCGTTPGCHGYQSPTPTPTPTASVTPTPTPTASVTPTPTPTASVTPTPTPTASVTPTPTPTASVTPTPTPTATAVATTMSLKAAPTIVRLNRSVRTTGTAGPVVALAGAKVALKIERKVGTRWVKMKAVTRTVSATGAFSWTYKVVKRGPHRVTASIAKTSTHTAKKLVRSFRVR